MTDGSGNFLLVCDERGTKSWSSKRRTFTFGGFASAETNRQNLIDTWGDIKYQLCGSRDVELKWSHFFPGHHQVTSGNPLRETDFAKWSDLALWSLDTLFDRADIFPITTVIRKDRIQPDDISERTRKGASILDLGMVMPVLLGQFAQYLEEHNGTVGEIWCDRLGSQHEEACLQDHLAALIANVAQLEPDKQRLIERVSTTIHFLDSKEEPLIQMADFVSGVIWAAVEGDEQYLIHRLMDYAPGGKRTYGIAFIES